MITNRTIKSPAIAVFAVLLLVSLGVTYFIANRGVIAGTLVLISSIGLVLLAGALKNYRLGFYIIFLMGIFMFYIDRIVRVDFPVGTVYDAFVGLVFFALFLDNKNNDWRSFKNPVTITFIILIAYQVLQLFNPNATSAFAWLVSLRNNTSFLLYVIAFQMFSSLKEVKRFTALWMAAAFFIGGYGIYQNFFGLSALDLKWMNEVPERAKLYINWGELRVFSILNDPSSYGLFTAMSSLAALVLALGPFKTIVRLGYGVLTILLLMAMSYSGTRTALAMVAVGVAFYVIIMLHNRRTLFASAVIVMIGIVLLIGPFYGSTMSRLRSTFRASEDPSMAVRDYKRLMFQQYIQTHPIGGGLNSVGNIGYRYSPGHELAGQWEPDSGYLLTALESGWIGLIIFQGLFLIVIISGINNFFALDDPMLKTYILVYIVPFMALSVAHFTQDAMYTKPMNVIVYATYALIFKIPALQKKLFSVEMV